MPMIINAASIARARAISTDDQTKPGITIGELRVQYTMCLGDIQYLRKQNLTFFGPPTYPSKQMQ